jgi:NitT/TauT family transport system substrate-binding protein
MRRRAFLSITAAAAVVAPSDAQTTPQTLRIATALIDGGAGAYYALDAGFFKRAGITAEVTPIQNGGEIVSAVVSGSFDIGLVSISAGALAHERGLPLVLIAPGPMWSSKINMTALVVARDAPYHAAKDLDGKTIGLNALANVTNVGTDAWLDKNGGDVSSVKFLELPFATMAAAVAGRRVDAALLSQPFLDTALANASVRIIGVPYNAIANEFMISAWFCSAAFAHDHPDAIAKFAGAIIETNQWANRNHAATARILEKYTKVPVPPTMLRAVFAERLDPQLIQPVIDDSARYNLLKAGFPVSDMLLAAQNGR